MPSLGALHFKGPVFLIVILGVCGASLSDPRRFYNGQFWRVGLVAGFFTDGRGCNAGAPGRMPI